MYAGSLPELSEQAKRLEATGDFFRIEGLIPEITIIIREWGDLCTNFFLPVSLISPENDNFLTFYGKFWFYVSQRNHSSFIVGPGSSDSHADFLSVFQYLVTA